MSNWNLGEAFESESLHDALNPAASSEELALREAQLREEEEAESATEE